jgi:hypothetical protein
MILNQFHHVFVWGILLCGTAAYTTVPATPAAEKAHPRFDQAVLAAIREAYGETDWGVIADEIDLPATMRLQEHAYGRAKADLNGDGLEEIIQPIGVIVMKNGETQNIDGATGNHAWAIIQPLPDGGWRVLHTGYSTGPGVLDSTSHGYRDLRIGWHMSAAEGSVGLLRFDGQDYRPEWGTSYYAPDGSRFMSPAPIPPELLQQIVREQLSGGNSGGGGESGGKSGGGPIEVLDGGAFTADLDGDGCAELLLQINCIRVDGREYDLRSAGRPPRNWFVFRRQSERWVRLVSDLNPGPVVMPDDGPVRPPIGLSTLTETAPGDYVFHVWQIDGNRVQKDPAPPAD